MTREEEIEVQLRYIRRLRGLQPSETTMKDLARQESELIGERGNLFLKRLEEIGIERGWIERTVTVIDRRQK